MAIDRFPVEAGHIMLFARAIADPNPVYYSEEAAKAAGLPGVPAPPTFVQASAQFDDDYFLRPKVGQPWFGSGKNATSLPPKPEGESSGGGGGGGGLHAEQHYEYHRPLIAGEVLTGTPKEGKTWTKEGRRGGTLSFSESVIEYRDQAGELVVTARGVGVRTGKVVEQS
jgi:hypothetical protein